MKYSLRYLDVQVQDTTAGVEVGDWCSSGKARKWKKETETAPIKTEELSKPKSYDANFGGEFPAIGTQFPSLRGELSTT